MSFLIEWLPLIIILVFAYVMLNDGNFWSSEEREMKETNTEIKSSDSKSLYMKLLDIPIWAIYFLILSTIGITMVILARIWFPDMFDEEFFWRVFYSYLTLIVSTVVISKMAHAINFVRKQK